MTASVSALDDIEELNAWAPEAVELARRISLAVWVEPELLRRARLAVGPKLSAAAEADVWFSALVDGRSTRAMSLRVDVARVLRTQLAADRDRLDAAWRVIRDVHRQLPADIQAEEEITWRALRGTPADLTTIERLVESIAVALVQQQREGLARWAARALPCLPDPVQHLKAARLLAVAAYMRLDDARALTTYLAGGPLPEGVEWAMPTRLTTGVGVRLTDGLLEIGLSPESTSSKIDVLESQASVVEVSWQSATGPQTAPVLVEPQRVSDVLVGPGPVEVRTSLGVKYTLTPNPLRVYFSAPAAGLNGNLTERLVRFIDGSRSTLSVMVRTLDHTAIVAALEGCAARGVSVRTYLPLTDAPNPTQNLANTVSSALTPVFVPFQVAIGACVLVRDGSTVCFGPPELTERLDAANASCFVIDSTGLADRYTSALQSLTLQDAGGPRQFGVLSMEFPPLVAAEAERRLVELLAQAKRVRLISDSVDSPQLQSVLERFRAPDSDIRGVLGLQSNDSWYAGDPRFAVGPRPDQTLLLVDNQVVITSAGALSRIKSTELDDVFVLDSSAAASAYGEYFDIVFRHYAAASVQAAAESGSSVVHDSFSFSSPAGEFTQAPDARLDAAEAQLLLETARRALRRVSWGTDAAWQREPDRYARPVRQSQLVEDLVGLAIRGYRVFDALIDSLAGTRSEADTLLQLMRRPGEVNILVTDAPSLAPLAALVYDSPLDTNAARTAYRLCPAFSADLQGDVPLEETACFRGECPSRDAGDTLAVCPSGFWGFRHSLGFPVIQRNNPSVVTRIEYQDGPTLAFLASSEPSLSGTRRHRSALRSLTPDVRLVEPERGRDAAFRLLRDTAAAVAYFYGSVGGRTGNLQHEGISLSDIRASRRTFRAAPLVFLNTPNSAVDPDGIFQFVVAFAEAGAAGVIAPDITVFEPLATAFAEHCLRWMLNGEAVGASVRRARLALLKDRNPLGLAFVPYAHASLRLTSLRDARASRSGRTR